MPDITRVLVRNAREQDIPAVVAIDAETCAPDGAGQKPEMFQSRLTAFPNGFFILVADNEVAAYGCSEKWLAEPEPGTDENLRTRHQPEGRILGITNLTVKTKFRGRGYGLVILDKLIEIAHLEGCRKLVVETPDAQGFYLKRGFTTVQNRTGDGISLALMSLDLKPIARK